MTKQYPIEVQEGQTLVKGPYVAETVPVTVEERSRRGGGLGVHGLTDGAIDCDIHPGVPGMKALLPYMDDHWRDAFILRGMDNFDLASYPPGAPISCRPDWRPPHGKPGTDFSLLQSQALDAFGARYAICNTLYGGQAVVSETMGAAMCGATNDWIETEWLARDARLRASIIVPAQSPELAVAEIERKAHNKCFVQILLPVAAEILYGRSYHWPIYEIAEHYDLPVGLHAGSIFRHAPTANGWPSHYLHDYVSQSQVFEDQLLSILSQGVFEKFPKLRVVLIEFRGHLAPALPLARRQDMARRPCRGAVGKALSGGLYPRPYPYDRSADRRATRYQLIAQNH